MTGWGGSVGMGVVVVGWGWGFFVLWPSSNSVVDGVEIFFFTPEILKFSEMIHNKCVFFKKLLSDSVLVC